MVRSFKTLVFLCFLFSLELAFAQKTQVYIDPHEVYEAGVDFFEKKLYGPSNERFEEYLAQTDQEPLLVEKAKLYILMNNVKLKRQSAERELAEYLRKEPENNTTNLATFVLASYYFDVAKYKQAARWFDKVDVTNLPKDEWDETNFKMAYSFFKDDEYAKAKPLFRKISTQDGKYFIEANYYLGYIDYIEKNYDGALRSFEKIRDKGPEIMDLYIAQIHYAQNAYKIALTEAGSKEESKYGKEFTLIVAKSHFQLEEFPEALAAFKRYGINTDGLTPEEIWQMAFSYYHNGEYESAHPIYVKITGEDNALGQLANYQLGECFLKLDMKQNAFYAFGLAKEKEYNNDIREVSHFNYAKLAFELGQNNVAMSTTQNFITTYPNSTFRDDAQGMLAEMFLNLRNYTQAVKVLEEIQTFNPQSRSVYQRITYLRGEQLYLDQNYNLSSTYFKKALKFTPDKVLEAQSHFWLGEINFALKLYDDAIKEYNLFLNNGSAKQSRYFTDVYYALGYCYYMKNDVPTALNYFKQYNTKGSLVDNKTKYADNALRLGDAYYRLNKRSSAISSYSYVSSRNLPGSDYALYQQAIIYGLQDNYELRIATLKKIESNYAKSDYYERALFGIASTYSENLSQNSSAISYYNKLIATGIRSTLIAESYLRLALIYYSQGMHDRAIDFCEKTIREYDRTDAAHQARILHTQILRNTGRTDEIMRISGIARTTKDSLIFEAGMTPYRNGEFEKASRVFGDYIDSFPDGFFILQAHYFKAQALIRLNKQQESIKYLRYVANQPKNEYSDYTLESLGDYHFKRSNYDLALPYYAKLDSTTDERDPYINALIGQLRCHYNLRNLEEGKTVGKRILAEEKISKMIVLETNLIMGKIQLEQGNHKVAQFHLDYVSKESTGEFGAEAQYLSAVSSYETGAIEEARKKVLVLDDRFPSYVYWDVKGFILFSDLYVAEGDYFQARATLVAILENYEDGEQVIIDECNAKLKRIDELEAASKETKGSEDNNDEIPDEE